MFSPSFEEVQEIAKNKEYKNIPIAYEMYSDIATSIEVLKILKGISNHCYMLESVEDSQKWGRYTFLGFNPILEFTCQDGVVQIKGDLEFKDSKKLANGEVTTIETDNPGEIIKDLIRQNKSPKFDNLPSFTGGFVGYFADVALHFVETHHPETHQGVEDGHLVFSVDERKGIAESGVG